MQSVLYFEDMIEMENEFSTLTKISAELFTPVEKNPLGYIRINMTDDNRPNVTIGLGETILDITKKRDKHVCKLYLAEYGDSRSFTGFEFQNLTTDSFGKLTQLSENFPCINETETYDKEGFLVLNLNLTS